MLVKLPTWLSTLLNRSGRSQADGEAQMPPELIPPIARPAASVSEVVFLGDLGQDLLLQEPGVLVGERVVLEAPVRPPRPAASPGLMKMPIVTGISFLWIRLSKTIGTRNWPVGLA